MANEEYVRKEVCELKNGNLIKQQATHEHRLNAHSEDIKDLTKISTEIVATYKQMAITQELLVKNLEAQEKRVATLEEEKKKNEKPVAKTGFAAFMETKTFDWTVKALITTFILIVVAAIGKDVIDVTKILK